MARRTSRARGALIADAYDAGRELSTAAVLFHSALAERRGLTATETKALDVLLQGGPITHAELGRRIGLAPATVSNVIDRLENKGYARRAPHPDDRRRVLISADADYATAQMAPLFEDFVGELGALFDEYGDDDLRLIATFMREAARRQQAATERLPA